ncbi:MAG: hypothetical protein ACI8RZ_001844 [Myxococcota bacterium]|jgi:hypothetical protein
MTATLIGFLLYGCTGNGGDSAVIGVPDDTGDTVPDTDDTQDTEDTDPDTVPETAWPALVINEFMASNQTTITDETGSYSDWIELYNPTDEAVELGGWLMTDDLEDPTVWELDDTLSIEAGGFLLLWADKDPEEGPNHLDFGMSRDGGQIGLFAPTERAIDRLEYAAQASDLSAARTPDGSLDWAITDAPTPGASNQ